MALHRDWSWWLLNLKIGTQVPYTENSDNRFTVVIGRELSPGIAQGRNLETISVYYHLAQELALGRGPPNIC